MSESVAQPSPVRRFLPEIILILLVLLSGGGVIVSDYAPESGYRYWVWMTPVFGLVSIVAAWSRAQRLGLPVGNIVPQQAVHWLGVLGAVAIIYVLQAYGRLTNEGAGSAVLIVLALAAFLAGVYTDWRLSVLGIILGLAVVAFAWVESAALIIVPVLLVAVVALVLVMRR
jgi:hypothetical protein